jgi:hypothetical protein
MKPIEKCVSYYNKYKKIHPHVQLHRCTAILIVLNYQNVIFFLQKYSQPLPLSFPRTTYVVTKQ